MKPSESLFHDLVLPMNGLDINNIAKQKILAQKNIVDSMLKEIFLKGSQERTYEDILFIFEYLLGFQYFRKLKSNHGQECLFRMSQFAQLISQGDGTIILKKNEEANTIHFIIEGQVMQITGKDCIVYNVADIVFEENILKCIFNKSEFITSKNSTFITISGFVFRACLHKFQFKKQSHKIENLNRFLKALGHYDCQEMVNEMKIQTFHQHSIIYSINNEVDYVYFINKGTLSIGQKVGFVKNKDFSNICEDLLTEAIRNKNQFSVVASITLNDIFGFEEFIEKKRDRDYKVIVQSKICELAGFPVKLFFQKFNQVFNQKEFMQLIKMGVERKKCRNRIHTLQLRIFEAQKQSEKQKPSLMTYETLEPLPYENQIRSRPRSFLLQNSLLLPDDIQNRSFEQKNNKVGDFSLISIEDGEYNNRDKTKEQVRINYQIEKILHNNKSFDKSKFRQKLQLQSLQPDCRNYIMKHHHVETERPFDHLSLRQDPLIKFDSLTKQFRDLQNSRCSPLPQVSPLYSRLGKYQQKIVKKNQQAKTLLIIEKG